MNDTELDERLRTGLRSIVDAAGPAPRFPKSPTLPRGIAARGWLRPLGAAAAVVAVLVAGLFVLNGSRESTPSSASDASNLLGSWTLTGVVLDGVELDLGSSPREWTFAVDGPCDELDAATCPPGPWVLGSDACNTFARPARFDAEHITWIGTMFLSTLVGCPDAPLPDAFRALAMAEAVDYGIVDDVLTLTAGNARLTFSRSNLPPAPLIERTDPAPPTTAPSETTQATTDSSITAGPDDEAIDAGYFMVDGVSVAVNTELSRLPERATVIRHGGTIIDSGDGPRMCMGVVEDSYPPQCEGPIVDGLDMSGWAETVGDVTFGERTVDVSWPPVDDHVTLISQQAYEPVPPPEPPTLEPASFSEAELQAAQDAIFPKMAGGEMYIGSFAWGDATNRITVDVMAADRVTVRALAELVADPDILVVIGIAEILDGS